MILELTVATGSAPAVHRFGRKTRDDIDTITVMLAGDEPDEADGTSACPLAQRAGGGAGTVKLSLCN